MRIEPEAVFIGGLLVLALVAAFAHDYLGNADRLHTRLLLEYCAFGAHEPPSKEEILKWMNDHDG